MNYFTFDGIDSRTYNTYIATSNAFDAPGREDEVIKVPGSNNIYYLTEGTYKPFDIKLYCYIPSNMQVKTDDLRNFLLTKGTCRYTEAIRPNEFRVARFIEAYEIEVSDRVSAAFVLTFKAQPQRYLISNDPITTTATADTTTDTTMFLSTVPTPINISLNGNTTQEGSSGKNLLDSGLLLVSNWTKSGDVYSGDLSHLYNAYGTNTDGIYNTFTANTQYTFSLDLKADATTQGLLARFVYTDNTNIQMTCQNPNTTDFKHYTLTSESGKSISKLIFSYANGMTVYIKNMQLEKGSTETAFEPHISPTNPQVIHNVSGDNTVNVCSFNVWDEEYELGGYGGNGLPSANTDRIRSKNAQPINVLGDTVYYFKSPQTVYIRWYDENDNFIRSTDALNTSKRSPVTAKYLRFFIDPSYGTTYKHDICINVSNAEKNGTYEPYTRQSYPLYLPVENLLNLTNSTLTSYGVIFAINDGIVTAKGTTTRGSYGETDAITNGLVLLGNYGNYANVAENNSIEVTEGSYTLSADIVNNGNTQGGLFIGVGVLGARPTTFYKLTSGSYTVTATSGQRIMLAIWYEGNASATNVDLTISNIQLEKGTKANHYTPYGTTPIELNKIGTYQDYIYKNGGKWYVHKETASVDMGTLTYQTDNGGVYFYSSVSGKGRTNFDLLCTCYTVTTSTNTSGMTDYQVKGQTSGSYIFIKDSRYTSPTDLKTALSGETLKYNLATATNTEITDTTLINQLNNIEKAYSYNGTTNILQVSNDNGFMLEVVSLHSSDVSSDYKGEPIITVNSTGLIYFNGCVIKVNQAPMTINSQTMQAYNGVVNLNNYIEANDFPMIEAGTNVIGSEMPLSIVPNYWKL